jgi:hypothetical protein
MKEMKLSEFQVLNGELVLVDGVAEGFDETALGHLRVLKRLRQTQVGRRPLCHRNANVEVVVNDRDLNPQKSATAMQADD